MNCRFGHEGPNRVDVYCENRYFQSANLACNWWNAINQRQQLYDIMAVGAGQFYRQGDAIGIQVVFAPSDVVGFYKNYPQRKAMEAIPAQPIPQKTQFNLPAEPSGKDCCECGPDQPCRSKPFGRWRRQHPGLKVAEGDLIGDCNNERELLNLCQQQRIDTLIYMGVASNMCVLHRRFGMLNMKRYGLNIMFVSDLVQAITANGSDPAKKIPDLNFTPAKGSALVQRYLEQHLAPSFESRQLIAAAGLGPSACDRRPHIVFVMAEHEYKSNETLPALVKEHLEKDFCCTFLFARADTGQGRNDIPGLEAMYDTDLLVLSMRRRALPVTQMDHLERYIRSGKPIVGIRVSVVPFQVDPDDRPDGHVIWQNFDQEVLGGNYHGYDGRSRETGCQGLRIALPSILVAVASPIISSVSGLKRIFLPRSIEICPK